MTKMKKLEGCLPYLFEHPDASKLRHLVEIYYDVQKVRKSSFNRLREVGEVEGIDPDLLKKLERQIRNRVLAKVSKFPIYEEYLSKIKGVGPLISGFLLSYFDPHKAHHVSGFWKFAGLHVEGGFAVKREKKKKLGFNPKMRAFCWRLADSLLKQNTPIYRQIYDERKRKEEAKLNFPIDHPENCPHYEKCVGKLKATAKRIGRKMKKPPCKKHIHRRACRYMVKVFLQDLWIKWREMEGLPVSEPYAVAILEHATKEAPHGN